MKLSPVLAALISAAGAAVGAETVDVELTAKKATLAFGNGGVEQTMYTYNGTVPGPTIEVNVGDVLRVHFTNELDVSTTVHWHGVQLPAVMDGSSISQPPVAPGGSFTYQFELLHEATHWYHPHVMSDAQVDMGMYGALIVRDPDRFAELGLPDADYVALLDDALLGADDGVIAPHHADPVYDGSPEVKAERLLNGKIGNTRLVNGDIVPSTAAEIAAGEAFTVRFINVANTLFFRLSFPNHIAYVIGTDGGLVGETRKILPIDTLEDEFSEYSDPDLNKGLLLTPGERAVVWVKPSANKEFVVEWHDMPVGRHEVTVDADGKINANHAHPQDGRRPKETIISWPVVGEGGGGADDVAPPQGVAIERLIPPEGAETIEYALGHGSATADGDVSMFGQIRNGTKLSFADVTPDAAPSVNVGDVRYVEVANTDGHDHNWHLHGFHFQVVDMRSVLKNGTVAVEQSYLHLEWKDTVWIPRRPEAGGRTVIRLAAKFGDAGRGVCAEGGVPAEGKSGGWLAHCHMLEHGESGMMSYLQVKGCDEKDAGGEAGEAAAGDGDTSGATSEDVGTPSGGDTSGVVVSYFESWAGPTMGLMAFFFLHAGIL